MGARPLSYACLTEVVLAHKQGNSNTIISNDAGTCMDTNLFIYTSSEGLDVLARGAMCDTNTINIVSIK